MKYVLYLVLGFLVILAVASGVAKITLMEQELSFFSEFGFNSSLLIALGIVQVLGGLALVLPKSRFAGAIVIALSFLLSAVFLLIAGKLAMALVTLIFIVLLVIIPKKTLALS